jgi:hypothetical protein
MILNYGTWEIRYCIASVRVGIDGKVEVTYFAFKDGAYGLHLVDDINDESVLWYETEEEAESHRLNANECIVPRGRDIRTEERYGGVA